MYNNKQSYDNIKNSGYYGVYHIRRKNTVSVGGEVKAGFMEASAKKSAECKKISGERIRCAQGRIGKKP
jgi:hypothetical protein